MSFIKNLSMFLCMLLLITCSKESDVASDTYASNASQNTYTPPTTTTTSTTTTTTVTQFTLAVTATEGGSVSSSGGTYDDGTSVTITATANEGYRFTGWEGSDSTSESLTVTLNSDQTYQALFELIPVYTLSVTASAGGGTVSTEGGDFEEGTSVTITATANEGYRFTGWEGSDSTSESLTVTLNSDQTYQALFELIAETSTSTDHQRQLSQLN